ncbi:MAG: porin family protein [Bacteroidota bacterium]
MKKITIFMLLLCVGFTVNAQKKFSFGFKGGLNIASIGGDNSDGTSPRIGLHLGVMGELSLSDKFSIQPELVYSQQGVKQDVAFTNQGMTIATAELEARYNYLNLPILAKYYITENFSVEAGPQIGFLVSAEQEGGGVSVDADEVVNNIDFSAGVGLGYKLNNGLNFNARYNIGLSDINDVAGTTDKNFNGVLQLSIGYFLR